MSIKSKSKQRQTNRAYRDNYDRITWGKNEKQLTEQNQGSAIPKAVPERKADGQGTAGTKPTEDYRVLGGGEAMNCVDCYLSAFKREKGLDFSEDLKDLERRLDVLFIKHFGAEEKIIVKERDWFVNSKLKRRMAYYDQKSIIQALAQSTNHYMVGCLMGGALSSAFQKKSIIEMFS